MYKSLLPKLLLVALPLGLASPARAQTAPVSESQQRAANRQALRDARHTESPYKASHLNVTPAHLQRGSTERPGEVVGEPMQPSKGRLKRLHKRLAHRSEAT